MGKKVHQLPAGTATADRLVMIADATNGKMYKVPVSDFAAASGRPIVLTGVSSYLVPAGTLIEKVIVVEPTTISFGIGTTAGDDDILGVFTHTAPYSILAIDIYRASATYIYFKNTTGNTVIKLYSR